MIVGVLVVHAAPSDWLNSDGRMRKGERSPQSTECGKVRIWIDLLENQSINCQNIRGVEFSIHNRPKQR